MGFVARKVTNPGILGQVVGGGGGDDAPKEPILLNKNVKLNYGKYVH